MTDDEAMAAAVQEGLAGVRICPECGKAMDRVVMTHDQSGRSVIGWACLHKTPVYMLDDGTRLEVGLAREGYKDETYRFEYTRDEDLKLVDGNWVLDDGGENVD